MPSIKTKIYHCVFYWNEEKIAIYRRASSIKQAVAFCSKELAKHLDQDWRVVQKYYTDHSDRYKIHPMGGTEKTQGVLELDKDATETVAN